MIHQIAAFGADGCREDGIRHRKIDRFLLLDYMDLLHNLAPHMLVVISINLLYIVVKTSCYKPGTYGGLCNHRKQRYLQPPRTLHKGA